jgi:hypothetical protein
MIAFTIYDKTNEPYAKQMIKSFKHFHPNIHVYEVKGEELAELQKDDNNFFYRAAPTIARKLMASDDVVIKLDADQICLGNMDFVFNGRYDVGTVLNINRVDPKEYGQISITGVSPRDYYNCGLVVMKNRQFVNDWYELCHRPHFKNLQYGEQDILNILCHYGKFRVTCFDNYDKHNAYYAWHGLVAKGETLRAYVEGGEVIIPPDKSQYPDTKTVLKMYHFAGGKNKVKMNYRIYFTEEVIKFINDILNESTV